MGRRVWITICLLVVIASPTDCSGPRGISSRDGYPSTFDIRSISNHRTNSDTSQYLCRDRSQGDFSNPGVCFDITGTLARGVVPPNGTAIGFVDDDLTIYGTVMSGGQRTVFVATPGGFGRSQYTPLNGFDGVEGGARASNDRYVLRVKKSGENDWGLVTLTLHR